MALQQQQPGAASNLEPPAAWEQAIRALAASGHRLADGGDPADVLRAVVEAAAAATGAHLAVARVLDPTGQALVARAVASESASLAAQLHGSRVPVAEVPATEVADPLEAPVVLARAAGLSDRSGLLIVPVVRDGVPAASLELVRRDRPFDAAESALARLAASQLELAAQQLEGVDGVEEQAGSRASTFRLVGDALSTGSERGDAGAHLARLASETARSSAALLWSHSEAGGLALVSSHGLVPEGDVARLKDEAERALGERSPQVVDQAGGMSRLITLRLGQPPLGALQLLFEDGRGDPDLAALTAFGARAAHALRAGDRAHETAVELERTRTLLGVVAQAIAQLSLSHTLETTVERVGDLIGVERVAIYLRERGRLVAAAARGVAGPHAEVGEALLDLALGPFRGRGMTVVDDAAAPGRLGGAEIAAAAAQIASAVGVPLLAREEVIGLLAVYPPPGRRLSANESALVAALAAQLAIAVENARLHERTKQLREELELTLAAERQAARQLRALYEISGSFTESLSLDATLGAVARAVVESFDLDAAVIRMPDARRELLVTQAVHVRDPSQEEVVRAILSRPQAMSSPAVQRLLRTAEPVVLDPARAQELDTSHSLLAPFLEKGSSAGIVPIATSAEVLATLTLLSLDPSRTITEQTVRDALAIAAQAALAIDNARLYQQQKGFADTMQRSLLPRSKPAVAGIEVGDVYQSSARVDVGGDVYDFLLLPDGRLAVILGDVTGHGIEAAADMAMAKFVFRSLAREHPDPSDFLAFANEVVLGEIPAGKFVTAVYVTVDPRSGEVIWASAGHPLPRLVGRDGSLVQVQGGGLALGIESGQTYPQARHTLEPGASVVLYTDGLVESRRNGEPYGFERLDRLLVERRGLPAEALARAAVEDCRAFAGGEPADDCAVVVIKKLP